MPWVKLVASSPAFSHWENDGTNDRNLSSLRSSMSAIGWCLRVGTGKGERPHEAQESQAQRPILPLGTSGSPSFNTNIHSTMVRGNHTETLASIHRASLG